MGYVVAIVILFLIVFVIVAVMSHQADTEYRALAEQHLASLPDLHASQTHMSFSASNGIAIDEAGHIVCLFTREGQVFESRMYRFSDIIAVVLLIDRAADRINNSGVIEQGAISRIRLILTVNDMEHPRWEVDYLTTPVRPACDLSESRKWQALLTIATERAKSAKTEADGA